MGTCKAIIYLSMFVFLGLLFSDLICSDYPNMPYNDIQCDNVYPTEAFTIRSKKGYILQNNMRTAVQRSSRGSEFKIKLLDNNKI